jgi:hypothetical protein
VRLRLAPGNAVEPLSRILRGSWNRWQTLRRRRSGRLLWSLPVLPGISDFATQAVDTKYSDFNRSGRRIGFGRSKWARCRSAYDSIRYRRHSLLLLPFTRKNEHWEKVADESLHVPFYIDDNTGTVLVDPQGAELDLHRDFQEQYSNSLFSASTAVPPNVAAFLGRHGIDFCDKKTKVEEFCIKPKNCLFVLGTLSQNHGVSVSSIPVRTIVAESSASSLSASSIPYYSRNSQAVRAQRNKQSGEVIRLQGGDKPGESASMTQQEKVASALLRAGINNPAAWAVAGTIDPTSTSHASLATKAVTVTGIGGGTAVQTAPETFDREPATVLMKGERNPAFYISWRSQRTVVRSLGWKSGLMIWGGPALTLLCLYILSAYFRLF